MPFYERGQVRIHYEEVGSGFPLVVIPGGGLNSTVAGLATHPFNPFDEFKGEFRVIAADLRNAKGGQSSGPFEVDRPWGAYTDDHIGLIDHLGIREVSPSVAAPSPECSGPVRRVGSPGAAPGRGER